MRQSDEHKTDVVTKAQTDTQFLADRNRVGRTESQTDGSWKLTARPTLPDLQLGGTGSPSAPCCAVSDEKEINTCLVPVVPVVLTVPVRYNAPLP